MANEALMAAKRARPWRLVGWGMAASLLLVPLVAMQFTSEVNWTASDFLFAGALIGGVGVLFELTVRMSASPFYRAGAALALAAAFLLIWINGAVGIIGSENNPLNLLYLGVIAISLVGSASAAFRPRGMAYAMFAAAAAMAAMAIVALAVGRGEPPGPIGVIVLNGFFATLYFSAGWLFRIAGSRTHHG